MRRPLPLLVLAAAVSACAAPGPRFAAPAATPASAARRKTDEAACRAKAQVYISANPKEAARRREAWGPLPGKSARTTAEDLLGAYTLRCLQNLGYKIDGWR
jgi:hypothetical protein